MDISQPTSDDVIVLGLGDFDRDQMQGLLGARFRFCENPSAHDFESAQAAIVRADYQLGETEFSRMPRLAIAARTGVGTDRVDLKAATEHGVAVAITPGVNANAVAEGTMAHLLALSKQLAPLTNLVRSGNWANREQVMVRDLAGSRLGIVGWGRIGRRVGEMAEAFAMEVIAFDPVADTPEGKRAGSLVELLTQSDYLSLHVPLTEETRNLIGEPEIAQLPRGAVIVNCSRGGLVDLDAAFDALVSGHISGLGLDSFDPEPAEHHPIFDLPQVVLTPHVMGLSAGAKQATFAAAAEAIRTHFGGGRDYPVANPQVRNEQ